VPATLVGDVGVGGGRAALDGTLLESHVRGGQLECDVRAGVLDERCFTGGRPPLPKLPASYIRALLHGGQVKCVTVEEVGRSSV
jgi:hypothetical protein